MDDLNSVCLCEDSGTFQLRMTVPSEIQELVGKAVVRRSLGTSELGKAKIVADRYETEYRDLFEQLTTGKDQTIDAGIISYLLYCLRDQV